MLRWRTGEFTEYQLKTPGSGPHGLVSDPNGNIWFTANFKGYIGKLDPKTGAISEYPMPDVKAHDPHTLVFDQKGTLWFTVQSANMVGRLVTRTGEVKLVSVPTPHANPYGIVVNSGGEVRARVEHVFGDQKNAMGAEIVRTIGIVRARCKIGMTNLVYNMRRFIFLERMAEVAR